MALLAALYLQLRSQTRDYSFQAHRLTIDAGHLLLSAVLLYILLAGLWALSAHFLGRASGLPYKRALDEDFWTWSPLFFLALAPLALKHYLGREDGSLAGADSSGSRLPENHPMDSDRPDIAPDRGGLGKTLFGAPPAPQAADPVPFRRPGL
jgi:hypothetical protein